MTTENDLALHHWLNVDRKAAARNLLEVRDGDAAILKLAKVMGSMILHSHGYDKAARALDHVRRLIQSPPSDVSANDVKNDLDKHYDAIVDAFLSRLGETKFPKDSTELFDEIKGCVGFDVTNSQAEEFLKRKCPRFFKFSAAGDFEDSARYVDDETNDYSWEAIFDGVLLHICKSGEVPKSHGSLTQLVQDLVGVGDGKPNRGTIDAQFSRFKTFFAKTKG